jgi:hypothetical protein
MNRFSKLLPLAVNIALPLLIYHYAAPHFGERNALILSSIPPMLWSAIELARFRRLDAVSLLAVIGIFLSLAAMAFGGSPRLLLARESLVTGIIGLLFLGSLLLPRPLIFYLARSTMAKGSAEAAVRFESYWLKPRFVRSMYIMTWVWGLGLVFEAAVRFWMAFAWAVEQFLAISPFISYGIYFSLMGWTLWYARRLKAAGEARTLTPGE